jgi:hypothetical protein
MLGLLRVEFRKINVDRHRTVSEIRSIEIEIETKPLIFLDELLDFPKTQCRGLRNRVRVGNRVSFFYVLVFSAFQVTSCVDTKGETSKFESRFCRHSGVRMRWTREKLQLWGRFKTGISSRWTFIYVIIVNVTAESR